MKRLEDLERLVREAARDVTGLTRRVIAAEQGRREWSQGLVYPTVFGRTFRQGEAFVPQDWGYFFDRTDYKVDWGTSPPSLLDYEFLNLVDLRWYKDPTGWGSGWPAWAGSSISNTSPDYDDTADTVGLFIADRGRQEVVTPPDTPRVMHEQAGIYMDGADRDTSTKVAGLKYRNRIGVRVGSSVSWGAWSAWTDMGEPSGYDEPGVDYGFEAKWDDATAIGYTSGVWIRCGLDV